MSYSCISPAARQPTSQPAELSDNADCCDDYSLLSNPHFPQLPPLRLMESFEWQLSNTRRGHAHKSRIAASERAARFCLFQSSALPKKKYSLKESTPVREISAADLISSHYA
jgi:hypothetical protein